MSDRHSNHTFRVQHTQLNQNPSLNHTSDSHLTLWFLAFYQLFISHTTPPSKPLTLYTTTPPPLVISLFCLHQCMQRIEFVYFPSLNLITDPNSESHLMVCIVPHMAQPSHMRPYVQLTLATHRDVRSPFWSHLPYSAHSVEPESITKPHLWP